MACGYCARTVLCDRFICPSLLFSIFQCVGETIAASCAHTNTQSNLGVKVRGGLRWGVVSPLGQTHRLLVHC